MNQGMDIKQWLTSFGRRPTAARLLVLASLHQEGGALNAPQILAWVRRTRKVNKVTVYRILEDFVGLGILRRLVLEGRATYYELASEQHPAHPHFQCRSCGMVQCLEPVNLARIWPELRGPLGNRAEKIEILVEGTCRRCRGLG